jgi:hypothetical protein
MPSPIVVEGEQVSPDVGGMSVVAESAARELAAVFDRLPVDVVTAVVREAEHELAGQVTAGALAELLHRLAAFQLEQLQVKA